MKITVPTFLLCLITLPGFSQMLCGFDELQKRQAADKDYTIRLEQTEKQIQEYISSHPTHPKLNGLGTALYVIPVVVHVVHSGDAVGTIYNPTDIQIQAAIDYLNQIYDGTAGGLYGGVGDIQIQFKLAQRDPNCNPTNGIDRVDGSAMAGYAEYGIKYNSANGISDNNLKTQTGWDPARYYNVWVVNKIDGVDGTSGQFIAGYAYLASTSVNPLDGAVMLATQMKSGRKTLPHEIGHALGLYHPFQGSSGSTACPVNNNCLTDGDRVCDTDPITYNSTGGVVNFSCRTGINPCTGSAYSINTENNVMNYTNCFTLFTQGQKDRMLAVMSLASRASLAASDGDDPTNGGISPCAPKINFETAKATVTETTVGTQDCRGYADYTYNMTIGNLPSANATVTITTSGTAMAGYDYILTTNSNFTVPSNTLVFNAGSMASKSFKVRVFDDAAAESDETIVIDFTVNAGGGNAVKGNGVATSTIVIISNDNQDPKPATGQNVELSLNAGSTAYLGPYDEVFYYSNSSNVIVRIKNLTDFDYGCTQVRIDRAGTAAAAYTSNLSSEYVADKTVEVIPTFDRPNGSYELTMYYKLSEIQGWKTITGKNLADARLLKTPSSVTTYVPGSIPQGLVKTANLVSKLYGSDSSVTGTFNTGLAGGFAVGAPAIPLYFVYEFIGNGLWSDPSNWESNVMPPPNLPSGSLIIVNPIAGGQCILNSAQTVQPGGIITVNAGKKLIVQGSLNIVK